MKRISAIILAMVLAVALSGTRAGHLHAESQTWAVCYFRELTTDMDAKIKYPKKDPNGKLCAIIKIETPFTGFTFDTGTLGIVSTEQKVGEIWVYVPQGVRKITIGHTKGILREWPIPVAIRPGSVYVLKLEEDSVHQAEQYREGQIAAQAAAQQAAQAAATQAAAHQAASQQAQANFVTPTPFVKTNRKAELHTLHISATVLGANIFVDGKNVGKYTGKPVTVRVENGNHIITATYKEYSGTMQRVAVYESGNVHIRFNSNVSKALKTTASTMTYMEFCFYTAGTALMIPGILIMALDEMGPGITFTAIGAAMMVPGIVASVKTKRAKQSLYNLAYQDAISWKVEVSPTLYSTPDFASGACQKGVGLGLKITF